MLSITFLPSCLLPLSLIPGRMSYSIALPSTPDSNCSFPGHVTPPLKYKINSMVSSDASLSWCWERLKAGGEGDNRGWDGWMVSPTQRTWVWANSGRQWRTGNPGVQQSHESQRVRHDLATEQQHGLLFWKAYLQFSSVQFIRSVMSNSLCPHESQHARPPCPLQTPGVYSNSCSSSRWCHPAISSSVVPSSPCP